MSLLLLLEPFNKTNKKNLARTKESKKYQKGEDKEKSDRNT